MLKIILLEWNEKYRAFQRTGEKDVSHLSVDEAHKEAKSIVNTLKDFKDHEVSYHLEEDGKVLGYL